MLLKLKSTSKKKFKKMLLEILNGQSTQKITTSSAFKTQLTLEKFPDACRLKLLEQSIPQKVRNQIVSKKVENNLMKSLM